jgi:hypothetical protein
MIYKPFHLKISLQIQQIINDYNIEEELQVLVKHKIIKVIQDFI